MQYTLETAPYPQPVLAFGGALALQAFLASRKIRDLSDSRTSLYLATLASSGAGKDQPRRVIQRILLEVGLAHCIGDGLSSGEGLEDTLSTSPAFILLADEIDSLMSSIKHGRDSRFESIVRVLLSMYTSASSTYSMRLKAGKTHGFINQPALTLYGTAVPQRFYEAMSPKLLENGFFARLLILEAGERGNGQRGIAKDVPPNILSVAKFWADRGHGGGNLASVHPLPPLAQDTDAGIQLMAQFRAEADREWASAHQRNDEAAMAIWARAGEKAGRLALNYACSASHEFPTITGDAVAWACDFARHQTQRMLFMAGAHVAENEFEAKCKRFVDELRRWGQGHEGEAMPGWRLNRRLKGSAREVEEVATALLSRGIIARDNGNHSGAGRPALHYRLL
jgi:hypothetical protein